MLFKGEIMRRVVGIETIEPTGKVMMADMSAQEDTVFGFPAWCVAISLYLMASSMSVLGFALQKRGTNATGAQWRIFDVVLSREWVLGFLIISCAGVPMDLVAYSLAPLSLVTPLSGVTVALNQVLAPRLLGERSEIWSDAPATALIIAGTMFSTASGPRHDPLYSPELLWEFASDPFFQFLLFVLVSTICVASFAMHVMRDQMTASAKSRPTNPNILEVLLPSMVAATSGALTNVNLKAVGVLLHLGAPLTTVLPWIVLTAAPAAIQINYVTRGLQLYPQMVFIPIYSALLVLMSTGTGSIFYQEYQQMANYPAMRPMFSLGVFLIMSGISMFARRTGGESQPLAFAMAESKQKKLAALSAEESA